MSAVVSVILIRDSSAQITGGGCCGVLVDDDPAVRGRDVFREAKRQQQEMGVLHRAIREAFPADGGKELVAVVTVDPRNQLYLIAKLLRDVLCYRPGWRAGLRTATQTFALPAVIVNGRVLTRRGRPLDPDTLRHAIEKLLPEGPS